MTKHPILWADDDPDDMETFRDVLHSINENYEVYEFENGRALLIYLQATIHTRPPCLIVLDMNMPVLDGRQTLTILKQNKKYSAIPVVMFTTSNSDLDRDFCHHYGVEMITKPPSYIRLKEVVKRFLNLCKHV
jgi:CheY-like chemotaxis protein